MVSQIAHLPQKSSHNFQKVVDAFLTGAGLPFLKILGDRRIHRVFAK